MEKGHVNTKLENEMDRQQRRLVDIAIDTACLNALHDDASYREVGEALGMTFQAAAKRYPGASTRRPGGQPGNLR